MTRVNDRIKAARANGHTRFSVVTPPRGLYEARTHGRGETHPGSADHAAAGDLSALPARAGARRVAGLGSGLTRRAHRFPAPTTRPAAAALTSYQMEFINSVMKTD